MTEERSAGNPHATFCGHRRRVTDSDAPVLRVKFPRSTHPYVWTLEGWLYVAIVIDLFSRQVVSWSVEDHLRTSLCVSALQMAFCRRKPKPSLLHHSDRGSQYANQEYRAHLGVSRNYYSSSALRSFWYCMKKWIGATSACSC